ncbi:MAG: alpha-ketoglutarate-dependent dioxygenase AlkB [Pseudomonadota bacterium]
MTNALLGFLQRNDNLMQLSFLPTTHDKPLIQGLTYIPEYITQKAGSRLLDIIDGNSWNCELKRRTQHYGYKYDYTARLIDQSSYLGLLPDWLQELSRKLHQDKLFPEMPDQVIVNEYTQGQGIASHIDCVPCFGNTIASLSLNSLCLMDFKKDNKSASILLEPRSLILLSGEARYNWQHGITARKSDIYEGVKIQRQRRVSLTFRKVLL